MAANRTSNSRLGRRLSPLLVAALLSACGGGGSGDSSTAPAADGSEPIDAGTSEPRNSEPDDGEPDSTEKGGTSVTADTSALAVSGQVTSEGEGSGSDDLEPQSGGVLRIGLSADGSGFDTNQAISAGSSRIVSAMNDPLVAFDAEGEPAPWLAAGVEPSEDFLTWTITLRPDVRFHDGVAVDAAAVKANLDSFRGSASVGYGMALVTDIAVVDDLTLTVAMSSPWVAFDNYLAGQPGFMVSPTSIGTNNDFVGTGPFVLDSWSPGDSARVVRNDDYWRDDLPYLDAVDFKFISDPTVRRQALEAGDIDAYTNANDFDILDFLDDPDVDVWIGEGNSNESLFLLNTTAAPFD
ncbi:MAG: ABC transporter substrate-binding protein, partial [Ilumatobacter sp.]